jgi:hypothetical protein
MKRMFIFIAQFIAISIIILFPQERISLLNDGVIFSIPKETVRYIPRHEFASSEEYGSYYANNKISISLSTENQDTLLNMTFGDWEWDRAMTLLGFSSGIINLVRNGNFNHQELLTLLTLSNNLVAFSRGWGIISSTRVFVEYNGEIIGELYGDDGRTDSTVVTSTYGYVISLVVGDSIVTIRINLHDKDFALPPQMPEYWFEYSLIFRNYVWRDIDIFRSELYQRMETGDFEGLPAAFQRLRETVNMILDTLVIKSYERSDMPERTIRLIVNEEVLSMNAVIEEDVIDANNDNNAIMPDNIEDIAVNETVRTWHWLFLLLIPLVGFVVFIVIKKLR